MKIRANIWAIWLRKDVTYLLTYKTVTAVSCDNF